MEICVIAKLGCRKICSICRKSFKTRAKTLQQSIKVCVETKKHPAGWTGEVNQNKQDRFLVKKKKIEQALVPKIRCIMWRADEIIPLSSGRGWGAQMGGWGELTGSRTISTDYSVSAPWSWILEATQGISVEDWLLWACIIDNWKWLRANHYLCDIRDWQSRVDVLKVAELINSSNTL